MAEKTASYKYFGTPEGLDTRGMPVRVMVVDDEELTRKLISQVLRSVGYDVVGEAVNGLQALEMYKLHKPDLVTMDVRMPQMDGLKAISLLMEIDEDANVIMLTNENDRDTVTTILKSGARNYIVKPVRRQIILQKLREVRIALAEGNLHK